jgi:hypothetical protein
VIEQLSKLKRAGRCIGYMRLRREPLYGDRIDQEYTYRLGEGEEWFPDNIRDLVEEADEICPLVCHDGHGKPVFERDKVRAFDMVWTVYWHEGGCHYRLMSEHQSRFIPADRSVIEVLEDQA